MGCDVSDRQLCGLQHLFSTWVCSCCGVPSLFSYSVSAWLVSSTEAALVSSHHGIVIPHLLTPRPGSVGHTSSWLHPHLILRLCSANLSDSYFTNRQDRYVFLQDCAEIADFFTELVDAVGDVSLQLQGDDTVEVVDGMVHPYKGRAAFTTLC